MGVLLGYAPMIYHAEYLTVANLGAQAGVPVFTHTRALVELAPDIPIDGAQENQRVPQSQARAPNALLPHQQYVPAVPRPRLQRDRACERRGGFDYDRSVPVRSWCYRDRCHLPGPRQSREAGHQDDGDHVRPDRRAHVKDNARLSELRASDPGGLAIHDFLDEDDPADRQLLLRPLKTPSTLIASDAMPLEWRGDEPGRYVWPLPSDAVTHPRTAGTFARATTILTKESGVAFVGGGPSGQPRTSPLAQALGSNHAEKGQASGRVRRYISSSSIQTALQIVRRTSTAHAHPRVSRTSW